jgi:hypothetical protein
MVADGLSGKEIAIEINIAVNGFGIPEKSVSQA